jgi:hypothetical protein
MPHLTITSEIGMFHSACLFECTARPLQWYGFMPARPRSPISKGKVDHTDREGVMFEGGAGGSEGACREVSRGAR